MEVFLARRGKPSRSCRAFSSNTSTNNYFLVVREPPWYPWFLTRIIYDILCFIQESCVFWLSYFYKKCFSAFYKVMWEDIRDLNPWFPIWIISDFLDFKQGSNMISRISFKNLLCLHTRIMYDFLGLKFLHKLFSFGYLSHLECELNSSYPTRIIHDFLDFTQESYVISLVPCEDHI